jgi:antitoxin HicB
VFSLLNNESGATMSEILLNLRLEPLDEGGYLVTSPDLNGLIAQGRTVAETLEIAQDVARRLIESYIEHGDLATTQLASRGCHGSTAPHVFLTKYVSFRTE